MNNDGPMRALPWVEHSKIWKTESAFMSWVRGGIRSGLWKKHPVKLEFLKQNTELMVNTNTRSMKRFPMVAAARCVICKELHSKSIIEVDHKIGNSSLRSMDDVRSFIESMIMVSFDDLQLVCKSCHKIKTHAEKKGITFKQAKVEKLAIEVCKGSTDAVQAFLRERGYTPAGNAAKRRLQVIEALQQEEVNE
jgi:hypothetical protein